MGRDDSPDFIVFFHSLFLRHAAWRFEAPSGVATTDTAAIDRAARFTTMNTAIADGKAPKVLHVLSLYRPTFTGHGIFWEKLWPALAALGGVHDVLVVETPRPEDLQAGRDERARLMYLSRSSPNQEIRKILELNYWLLLHLRRYDILHFHSHVDRFFISHWIARFSGVPIVYSATLNDTIDKLVDTYRPFLRWYARFILGRLDHLIVIGKHLAENANRILPSERISLIRNGVQCSPVEQEPIEIRRDLGISQTALVLLSVGVICRRKDQRLLIEQHRRASTDGKPCHLVLLGPEMEADYAASLRNIAAERGITDLVHFVGYTDAPAAYYAMADIFVFASTAEGFGNVVAEAMYMGLPVVARRLPDCTDFLVEHGQRGFLFDQAADYQRHVEALIDSPALRSKFGRAAQQWTEKNLSMEVVAEQYQQVYNRLASPHD